MSISVDFTALAEGLKKRVHGIIKVQSTKATAKYTTVENVQLLMVTGEYDKEKLEKRKRELLSIKNVLEDIRDALKEAGKIAVAAIVTFKTLADLGIVVVTLVQAINKILTTITTAVPVPFTIPPSGITSNVTRASSETLSTTSNTLIMAKPKITEAATIVVTAIATALFIIENLLRLINLLCAQIEKTLLINEGSNTGDGSDGDTDDLFDEEKDLLELSEKMTLDSKKLCAELNLKYG